VQGRSLGEYAAPLFVAWQLTNRCNAQCIACCEESGPTNAWRDELTRDEALALAQRIAAEHIPYVAFGGGEPLGVPHCWDVFALLAEAGVSLKLETDGRHIDAAAADRLAALPIQCVQISVDGASAVTHERSRPGSSFAAAIAGIERLVARRRAPQMVFVPNRFNIHEAVAAYELAVTLGCEAFVTGPMMRIGRAATAWDSIACSEAHWQAAVGMLQERAQTLSGSTRLAIYPWNILTEMRQRRESPQAMLLIVPNGMIKLMNALPFAPADLRRDSFARAWQAYKDAWRSTEVGEFIGACLTDPGLLRHANETWPMSRSGRLHA
jgi:MoaA/NifB/PqqE/SkfB family radical SAM enzyme